MEKILKQGDGRIQFWFLVVVWKIIKTVSLNVMRRYDDSVLRVALNLKVMARESEDDWRKPGRSKWRRRRKLIWKRKIPWIETSGETECEQLQKERVDLAISAKGQHRIKTELLLLLQQTSLFWSFLFNIIKCFYHCTNNFTTLLSYVKQSYLHFTQRSP